MFEIGVRFRFKFQRRCCICRKVRRGAIPTVSPISRNSNRYSYTKQRLLSVFSCFRGRTGTDVAERRASTVARTLKVLKGCILQQQSVMRARASGTSQGAEGMWMVIYSAAVALLVIVCWRCYDFCSVFTLLWLRHPR